jgi:mono/diheme cytochrome c family protein
LPIDRFVRACALPLLLVAALGAAGCRQDMHNQPKLKPLAASDFFVDGRGSRPLPEGTVARGHLNADDQLYTGKVDGQLTNLLPFPATRAVLKRGQDRFNVYCTPCHGPSGAGNGMIVQRGLKAPPSFHIERLRTSPVGYFFDVMTNGFGAMQDYRAQIATEDRWAIAAYIRALQLSQHAPLADVPADKRSELEGAPAQPPAASQAPAH